MGYFDVDIVIDGAFSEGKIFEDDDNVKMASYMEQAELTLATLPFVAEIHVLYHSHSVDFDGECICFQYVNDHAPRWTNRDILEDKADHYRER